MTVVDASSRGYNYHSFQKGGAIYENNQSKP